MSQNRKTRRKKQKLAEKEMKEAMGLYTNMPEQCLMCEEKFDKKDKKMLKTWNVVVRKKEKVVNIYCPSCWNMAMQAVKEGFEAGKSEFKYEEENNDG